MKVEQIIDEMQASLTKLRGWLRTTGKERKCAGGCGRPALHSSNFCGWYFTRESWKCKPLTGTTGKCTCNIKSKELAGICNYCYPRSKMMKTYLDLERELFPSHSLTKEKVEELCTPDLPLNAKVAEALGWDDVGEYHQIGLAGHPPDKPYPARGIPIPPYDTDLEAAMGALEEYCLSINRSYKIVGGPCTPFKIVTIGETKKHSQSLPQAICLAIVSHAEAR